MTDTNDATFGSDRGIEEKLQAEVLESNGQTYFVKYGEDDADIEPRTRLNELIFETDEETKQSLYDMIVYGQPITCYWTTNRSASIGPLNKYIGSQEQHEVSLHAYDGGSHFEIEENGEETPVPSEFADDVVDLVTTFGNDEETLGQKLRSLRNKVEEEYVNRNTIEQFIDRYPEDRVRVARNGWIIDDTFIVQYDAENYLADDPGTWKISGGDVVQTDESHESVDLSFNIGGEVETSSPSGETHVLDETEVKFLATVETLLHPEEYLGYDHAGRVIEHREEESGPEHSEDPISEVASTANERAFKDDAGQVHGHSREKHTLTASFGVTDDVLERLHFQQNGHVGVHELTRREREFRRADFDVFHDTHNQDSGRWQRVKSAAKSAPISDKTQRRLDQMFGSR